MNILVTGFDAFGDNFENPSSLILDELPAKIENHSITTLQIPTSAHRSKKALKNALSQSEYDALVCIGQAGGRADISLERVAINLDEFRIADNDGEVLSGNKICSEGPDAYLSKLPLKTMVNNIQKHSIPASISYTAGTFVCNHVYYLANYLLSKEDKAGQVVFIHVPFLPRQVATHPDQPSMSLNLMVEAIIAAIEVIDKPEINDSKVGKLN